MVHLHWRRRIWIANLMATLYCAEHVHIALTRTQISTLYFCIGQESESESVPESVSCNVNDPQGHYVCVFTGPQPLAQWYECEWTHKITRGTIFHKINRQKRQQQLKVPVSVDSDVRRFCFLNCSATFSFTPVSFWSIDSSIRPVVSSMLQQLS